MSMTNPGIFCPFPEAGLLTLMFAIVEKEEEKYKMEEENEKSTQHRAGTQRFISIAPMSLAADNGYDTITGTVMFNAGHDDMETDHPCPFTYSDGYFTETAYKYRQDLAAVTMAMCLAAGNVADPERTKARQIEDFFDQIGFEDFEANADFTNRPGRNTFGVGIANKEIRVNGEKYTVIAVGLRGCGYYAEWAGDLNVGLEGEHTGFAICREKALAFLQTYLAAGQRDHWQNPSSGFSATVAERQAQICSAVCLTTCISPALPSAKT